MLMMSVRMTIAAAVVADEAVDPVECPKQRDDDDREHPEVDRPNQIAIDGGEHVEILGADIEPHRAIERAGLEGVGHQLSRRSLHAGWRRNGDGLIGDRRHPRRERHAHEVVIVDASVLKVSLVARLLCDIGRRKPCHRVGDGEQPSRNRGAGPHTAIGIAKTRTPFNRRRQAVFALHHRHIERDEVGGRVELELLDDLEARRYRGTRT